MIISKKVVQISFDSLFESKSPRDLNTKSIKEVHHPQGYVINTKQIQESL